MKSGSGMGTGNADWDVESYTTGMDSAKSACRHEETGIRLTDRPVKAGDVLTFAQLSDPHLSSLEGIRFSEVINKRLLGYLSWHRRRRLEHRSEILDALGRDLVQMKPDHIVVTGDLTHIGLQQEFVEARTWLQNLGSATGVTVIPGNHDAYVASRWEESFAMWLPFMVSDKDRDASHIRSRDTLYPSLRVRGPIAFIGLSSAWPSAPFLATGRLGSRQLDRLPGLLEQAGRDGLFRVVLLHHPPHPEDEKWRKRLVDGRELCAQLEQHGVDLLLHGHTHRPMRSRVKTPSGNAPVIGIPSASAAGKRPGSGAQYNLYRVARKTDSWSVNISVRGYENNQDRFVAAGEEELNLPLPVQGSDCPPG